ncbi:MAG: quinone-dependent dihydroorotate dehydrogenase [Propionicimonas sp.]|uniref:quinone-dependent dihydroorotate dehydrogenase n=1 Tax=Propionicimonas sp. TaxID=1955623 RepID=UPI002B21714D|nr:quinone-dependent dihydroorotate dehydrogenase [Propionicimonas sp.]MEA4943125.1 quinone-dependent dihydroorotate dehydrogenase [Propionicimonas sp.]
MGLPAELLEAGYTGLLRPLLFASHGGDPEAIHEQEIDLLARLGGFAPSRGLLHLLAGSQGVPATVAGIRFPNRVGLAAGLDKDGLAARAWTAFGFGFAELGTVTARAQPGNDRPRIFRAPASAGVVNRMGFNNRGAAALAATLNGAGIARGNGAAGIPLGISLGKTKVVAVEDAVADYLASLDALAGYADYLAINVSSPNTPNLRSLQDAGALAGLTAALVRRAAELAGSGPGLAQPVPIFVKVAPDLSWPQLDQVLAVCQDTGIAGIIATNTTLRRDGLAPSDRQLAAEAGGLSGAPLTTRALDVVGYLTAHTTLPVIGVGGIMTVDDALAMFDAGARLVQLYTGFIYHGPGLVAGINAADSRRNRG